MTHLCPLTFEPAFKDYVWGGWNLVRRFGRRPPEDMDRVAETWEISAHPHGLSHVASGPLKGWSLSQVMESWGASLLGSRAEAALRLGRFPLLVKLLDAARDLSVQVHPGDDYAQAHGDDVLGKTEAWYVLHADPGAQIIYGVRRGVARQQFQAALEAGTLEQCLHVLPVQVGDVVLLRPGTVHSVLAGLVVVEVQQASDATYRVYDWNRLGSDGKPRPLHIDKALDVIDFSLVEPGLTPPVPLASAPGLQRVERVRCQHFVVEETRLAAGAQFRTTADGSTFEIWACLEGLARLEWDGEPIRMPGVRFVLVPAALGDLAVCASEPSLLLRIYLPGGEDS
jgi:mannose-6-phosphate isomerase